MTEEQKKLFIEWLDKTIELTKELYRTHYCKIEGLYEYAGCCASDNIVLENNTFNYAIECLTPVINEREVIIDEKITYFRSFIYKDIELISVVYKEN